MSEENKGFNFGQFIEDSKNALLKPKEYFNSMAVSGGLGEPIIKAVLYGFFAGLLTFIWVKVGIGTFEAGIFGKWLGSAVGIMGLVWSVIGALIGLFIGGVIMLILSAICGGSTDFEANLRVVASLMVISVIKAAFGFLGFMSALGTIIDLVISLYSIWMLYHALFGSLKGKESSAKVLSIIIAVLIVLSSIVGMGAKKAASSFMDTDFYEEVMEEAGEALEEAAEAMEEAAEEIEEAAEGMNEDYDTDTDENMEETLEDAEEEGHHDSGELEETLEEVEDDDSK